MNRPENIPDNLVEILRNAEVFEVYFLNPDLPNNRFSFSSKYLDFQANLVERNVSEQLKEDLISAFLNDVEKGGEVARCWIPHHGIRVVHNNQLVEIAVCFMCGKFRGKMPNKELYGTLPDEEESKSRIVFDKIITTMNPIFR